MKKFNSTHFGGFQYPLAPLLIIAGVATLFVLLNALLVSSTGSFGYFSATGYSSNIARVHDLEKKEQHGTIMLGSSITGRLLPEFFQEQGLQVTNLGIDGGGAATAVELFLDTDVRTEVLVVETNGLRFRPRPAGEVVLGARSTVGFKLAHQFPVVQPQYRPSAVLYTRLKRWKDTNSGQTLRGEVNLEGVPEVNVWNEEYIRSVVLRISQRAEKIYFVSIPSKAPTPEVSKRFFKELSQADSKFVFVDLSEEMKDEGLLFTDQVHLSMPSARRVSQRLVEVLAQQ